MSKPFDFATDSKLPNGIGALMQAAANKRAAQGFISPDGQTHLSAECCDIYDNGKGVLSAAYRAAAIRAWGK